jgi:hypothetical protein
MVMMVMGRLAVYGQTTRRQHTVAVEQLQKFELTAAILKTELRLLL